MANNLNEELASVDSLKSKLDSLRPLKPEQERIVFEKLRLDWNYHSNAIEGNQLTLGETRLLLMEGLTADGKPLKDYLDIQGHDHVIGWLLGFLKRKEELTEVVIRGMHEMLLVKPYEVTAITPEGGSVKKVVELGKYKSQPNQVTTPTGAIRRFALPEETPARMGELMKWLRSEARQKDLHPIAIAAAFHHQFVSIHPFDDGNGRMGRILMNLLLMQDGYPPAVIQLQDRDAYFAALGKADVSDIEPFISFIAEKVERSLDLYLRAAKGESVEDFDDVDKRINLLKQSLNHIPDPPQYSPEVFAEFLDKTLSQILTKVLKKLNAFDELFLKSSLRVTVHQRGGEVEKSSVPLILRSIGEYAQHAQSKPAMMQFHFSWEEFKKSGLYTFNISTSFLLRFFPLKYEVEWPGQSKKLEHHYRPALDNETTSELASSIAKECLADIEKNLSRSRSNTAT